MLWLLLCLDLTEKVGQMQQLWKLTRVIFQEECRENVNTLGWRSSGTGFDAMEECFVNGDMI